MASIEDYAAVRRLVADLVSEGVEAAVPKTIRKNTEASIKALLRAKVTPPKTSSNRRGSPRALRKTPFQPHRPKGPGHAAEQDQFEAAKTCRITVVRAISSVACRARLWLQSKYYG